MTMAIQSAVSATAKIHKLKIPSHKELRILSENIFKKADIDNSQTS